MGGGGEGDNSCFSVSKKEIVKKEKVGERKRKREISRRATLHNLYYISVGWIVGGGEEYNIFKIM